MNSNSPNDPVSQEIRNIFVIATTGTAVYIILTSIFFESAFDRYILNGNINGFYPYFLSLGALLIFFAGILLFRSYSMEHSSLYILTLAVFLQGLSYCFGFLNYDPTGEIDFTQTRLFQLQVLSQTVSIFLIYLHYELNSYNKPRTKYLIPTLLLLWPNSLLNIFYLITNTYQGGMFVVFNVLSLTLMQIGVTVIFLGLLYNGIGITKLFLTRDNASNRRAAMLQLAGLIILVIGIIFQIVERITVFDVAHTPLNVVAISLIGIPYLQNPNVMILSPVNVMVIGVIDSSGRTMYFKAIDKDFADDATIQTTSDLFGGLTLALSSLGKEVARTEASVDSLQFSDRSIIVEYLEPYYLVVIANTSTYYLEKEMEEYLGELVESYPSPPRDGSVIPEVTFDKLNSRFFPVILQI